MNDNSEGLIKRSGTIAAGFTLLDGIALVIGAAIASVHLKQAAPPDPLTGTGWVMMWLTFAGVALTASGPFLAWIRRRSGRPGTSLRLGDWLWVLLGTPWALAAIPRIVTGARNDEQHDLARQLYDVILISGLGAASLVTLVIVWARWVIVPPNPPDVGQGTSGSWTERIGLTLAVAWPLQCAFGMVVLGTPS
ncbi:hypothetical protein [Tautonia marina]|uniref:hypothetical protein n=1 Tax=Tautonia marina TaxID=2653855 RepID=UPI001261367A|nr:hypothetical protein [Tautonia marina]